MEKKGIASLALVVLLCIPAHSGTYCHTEEFSPKHALVPSVELSHENQEYIDFLDSIFFEETSFIGKKFTYFIDKMSHAVINDAVVSFSESDVTEKRIEFKIIHSEAFLGNRVNFESRKISYLQVIDLACGQLHAVWTVDNQQIYIMPTKMKFEIRKNPPSINPFDS